MVPTRALLAAAAAALTLATNAAANHAPAPEPPPPNAAPSTPALTLLDRGEQPRRLLRRTLRPGLSESISTTSAASSVVALVDGDRYPPAPRPPVIDRLSATLLTDDPSAGATFELAIVQTSPAPLAALAPDAGRTPEHAHDPILTTIRLDASGAIAHVAPLPASADDAAHQKLSFWERKLRLLTPPLPDRPVGPGARWSVASRVTLDAIEVDQIVEYTLEAIDADRLTIRATLSVASSREHPLDLAGLPEGMTGTITGLLVKGTARFTVSLGSLLPIDADDDSEIVLLSRVRAPGEDDLQLVQYVQNRLTTSSGAPELAEADPAE